MASISARRASRYSAEPFGGLHSLPFAGPLTSAPKPGGAGLSFAALVQNLDALLGLFESRVAEARQMDAALVELQRRFERQVAFFELLDDGLELGDRGLEVFDGRVHCVSQLGLSGSKDPSAC